MDDSPEESPKKESPELNQSDVGAIGDQECSTSSDSRLQSWEPHMVSTTEGARTSNRGTSFFELGPLTSEFDDDDDDDVEIGNSMSFSKRRTFSQCDSPIRPLPECKIYDSEAENKEMGSSDHENNLQKFMVESAAWSKVRRRFRPTRAQRVVNSDGATMDMSFCTSQTETSTLLKRSLSAPPDSSSDTKQKERSRIRNFFDRIVESVGKSKQSGTNSLRESPCKTKASSENPEDSCSTEIGESTTSSSASPSASSSTPSASSSAPSASSSAPSARTPESSAKLSVDKIKATIVTYESELTSDDTNRPSSKDTNEPSPENAENTNIPLEGKSNSAGFLYRLLTSEKSSSSKYPEFYGSKPSYPTGSSLAVGTSSPENSEDSRMTDDELMAFHQQCSQVSSSSSMHSIQSYSTDSPEQKSPPQITSEPPSSASSAIKVPTKPADAKTPVFIVPGPPEAGDDNAALTGSGRKRPTDFNVKRRSAFYSFCSTSPTGLILRPYHSLPNVHKPPAKNSERRSIGLENRRRRVVRSLFSGNFHFRRYTPGSNMSSVSKEILSLERDPSGSSSEERPSSSSSSSSSKGPDSKEKYKVCKKLVFTSPSKETNVNQTLQDNSSSELIGEISSLNLNAPSTSEDHPKEETNPKRKEVSPFATEKAATYVKKPRSSSEFRAKETSGKLAEGGPEAKEEAPANLLQLPSGGSAKENTSPKRKVGDLDVSRNPGATASEGQCPESALKRTRVKPPTPVDEVDMQESLQKGKEIEPKE